MATRQSIDPLLILAGPTGAGKSELAMALARRWNGAIVSADSMQVYRGLAIGTAQPSAAERGEIPHRLVGHVAPTELYDAARFVAESEQAVAELESQGHRAMIVGGTGMYLKALVEGIFEGPSRNTEIRRRLQAEADESGSEALHERLRAIDPDSAERIRPRDTVRIVRALEVHETTGRPLSWWHTESRREGPRHDARYLVATRDREDLYARIDNRVKGMLESGWIGEVRGLLASGIPRDAPGLRALGYQEIVEHLDGRLDATALAEAIARASRRYAKRQLTWFRAVKGARWINLSAMTLEQAVETVSREWGLVGDETHASRKAK